MLTLIMSALRALIDLTSQVIQVQLRTEFDLRCLNKNEMRITASQNQQ